MDDTLPLDPLVALLPIDRPFTPVMARTVGVPRASLDRMLRDGTVRRLLRGVYVAGAAPDSIGQRASAVALAVGREAVAVDRTAAWVHGVDLVSPGPDELRPLEVLTPGRSGLSAGSARSGRSARGALGSSRQLSGRDVQRIEGLGLEGLGLEGLRLTTPLRTALDLGRLLPPDLALGAMDRLLAGGAFTHVQLLAEIPRLAAHRGVGQLRVLAAQVDARSHCLAESALRLRWHEAHLPTAVPGLSVRIAGRTVRLGLGVERRQFGTALAHQVSGEDLVALEAAGWRVVVLSEERVLHGDPLVWIHHLEREFHQHLLAQVEAG